MTDALLRRGHYAVAPVQRRDLEQAYTLCAGDPVAAVVPLSHLETALRSGITPTGLWAVRAGKGSQRDVVGVLWNGANLTAVLPGTGDDDDDLRAEVAAAIVGHFARPAAMVGPAELTLDLWGRLEPWWGPAREIRQRQLSMVMRGEPSLGTPEADLQARLQLEPLRRSTMDDYEALLPAAVHMFVGEVGYDPMTHGREAYEDRLRHLVRQGRSYIMYGVIDGQRCIVFKAEVGVVGGAVAQVQGVWVHPAMRGNGLGKIGMAALVGQVRADHAPHVSLYVNDFNDVAVRTYTSVGFETVGAFATVMF